jgi:acyl-[acyl-carrier-protein] desaturase
MKQRKVTVYTGYQHDMGGPVEAMAYTSIQEMATRAFYICTAEACQQEAPDLARALQRIAKDETLHMAFYRDVVKAHLDSDPDYIEPIAKAIVEFQMPGYILEDYRQRSEYLARTKIFGPEHFYKQVMQVLWSYWGLDEAMEKLSPERRAALRLDKYRSAMQKLSSRYERQAGDESKIVVPATVSYRPSGSTNGTSNGHSD